MYKVVSKYLKSYIMDNTYRSVEYKINEWVKDNKFLCVFKNIHNAVKFCENEKLPGIVYKCKIKKKLIIYHLIL